MKVLTKVHRFFIINKKMSFFNSKVASVCFILFQLFAFPTASEAMAGEFEFLSGPNLQLVSRQSVHVTWAVNGSATSWVEYGPDRDHNQIARRSEHGLFDANRPVQKAVIDGLKPGTDYFYRTVSVEIKEYGPYQIEYGDTLYSDTYRFSTAPEETEPFSFLAFNDVHNRPEFIGDVFAREENVDFAAYLGDIMGHIDGRQDIIDYILEPSSRHFAAEVPFFYVRGNHEARGAGARKLIDYIATPDGSFYYTFEYGSVFFIVLDTGEDKPDTNQYYFGLADFDAYRAKQGEWLQKVVESEAFQQAGFRVVLSHWPILLRDVVARDDIHRHGRENTQQHFARPLHDNGVDLQLAGHTHRHEVIVPEEGVSRIYTVVGGGHTGQPGSTYTRVNYREGSLHVLLKSTDGELIEEILIH